MYPLEVVAFDKDPRARCRRNGVLVIQVVVVEDVHGVPKAHAGVPRRSPVKPVVVVRHAQVPRVSEGGVAGADERYFLVIHEHVPRDGDKVRRPPDVDAAVETMVERVMIDPHVGGPLDVDCIISPVVEVDVPDDDVSHVYEVEAPTGDGHAQAIPKNRLVGSHRMHAADVNIRSEQHCRGSGRQNCLQKCRGSANSK